MTKRHFIASSILVGLTSLNLASCGFQPVYGSIDAMNAPIQVLEIEGRTGHRLRQELSRTLRTGLPGIESGAFLNVNIEENLQRLNLKANVGVSRTTIIYVADYTLRGVNGDNLLNGSVTAQTDYDVADSDYGDIALQNDARERVAFLLARRLHEQLTLDASSSRQDAQMAEALERELEEAKQQEESENQDKLDRIP
ncbi:LPS assembly lipoprotein LptE [Hirschia litorea]|uniref:LPS assembly lipoprotein LptE n=1 Tax=Hirschia litorea TaxID=1199156 RepID=A0ABW2IN72_9PROT